MAEFIIENGIKTIAFYLPQFHSIPENDKYWGKGFTEWVNVKKAKPLFEGQYQPKVPLNNNYYNLLDDDIKIWQSNLATSYGVDGFCYYHYWFKGGKKLLEKPVEQMLLNKKIEIPFCLCWANENWAKNWDGGNQEIIVEQDYGKKEEWELHLQYLIEYFKDDRYITFDGKPVLILYRPDIIPNLETMLNYWNQRMQEIGLNPICFIAQNASWYLSPYYGTTNIQYQIKFQPSFAWYYMTKNFDSLKRKQRLYRLCKKVHCGRMFYSLYNYLKLNKAKNKSSQSKLTKYDYDEVWRNIISSEASADLIEGAFVDWDNTARKQTGYLHIGATPTKFEYYMKQLYAKIHRNKLLPVVFINAWNEWAEGAYLEPDEKNEFGYLNSLRNCIDKELE